jgi:hypothetical protein
MSPRRKSCIYCIPEPPTFQAGIASALMHLIQFAWNAEVFQTNPWLRVWHGDVPEVGEERIQSTEAANSAKQIRK